MPLLRVGQPEGEFGFGEGDGHLLLIALEVDARASGFDVRKAGGWAGGLLGGGGGLDAGGLDEDGRLEVPLAVGEVDEVGRWAQ